MKKFTDTVVYKIGFVLIAGYMLYTTISPLIDSPVKAFKCYFNDKTTSVFFASGDSGLTYLDTLKEAGINHLMFLSHESDKANYHSKYLEYNPNSPGLNSVFKKLDEHGFDYSIIFQFFYSPTIPDSLKQLDQYGDDSSTGWQSLACPNDTNFINNRLLLLEEVLSIFNPEIIHIDFLRFQYFWEEQGITAPDDTSRVFCYCERCQKSFSNYSGRKLKNYIDMHDYAFGIGRKIYLEWRSKTISRVLSLIRDSRDRISPKTQISVNIVPYLPSNKNIMTFATGQDITEISKYADILSPMLYSEILNTDLQYFEKYMKGLAKTSKVDIIPSIEIYIYTVPEMIFLQKEFGGTYSLFHLGEFLESDPGVRRTILGFN